MLNKDLTDTNIYPKLINPYQYLSDTYQYLTDV